MHGVLDFHSVYCDYCVYSGFHNNLHIGRRGQLVLLYFHTVSTDTASNTQGFPVDSLIIAAGHRLLFIALTDDSTANPILPPPSPHDPLYYLLRLLSQSTLISAVVALATYSRSRAPTPPRAHPKSKTKTKNRMRFSNCLKSITFPKEIHQIPCDFPKFFACGGPNFLKSKPFFDFQNFLGPPENFLGNLN